MAQDGPDDLVNIFNASARQYLAETIEDDLLLAKFNLLLKFRAKSDEEKEKLALALFDTAHQYLERRASPAWPGYISNSDMESITNVLQALITPDTAPLLPAKAPAALADTGMKFVQRAEQTKGNDRSRMTKLAQICLRHAEKFKTVIDRRNEAISTSKPISTAKRFTLKKNDGDSL